MVGALAYTEGVLHIEGLPVTELAARYGTPLYVYSSQVMHGQYRLLEQSLRDLAPQVLICYALKANANPTLGSMLASWGAGVDVVSGGELYMARRMGFPAEKIVFAGVGKTRPEMAEGLREGVRAFHVESAGELDALAEVAVKQCGGMAVVQDPADALYASMPRSAIDRVAVDHILPLADIPTMLVQLARETVTEEEGAYPVPKKIEIESRIARNGAGTLEEVEKIGKRSEFSCPECHGVLWELQDGEMLRFRCQTGHAYSAESMAADQSDSLDRALWAALRALEESSSLAQRMAERATERHQHHAAARFMEKARNSEHNAGLIKQVLASKLDSATAESVG